LLASVPGYDVVFMHREAAPIGPPVLEWVMAKVLRKRIIYDFDDAIWLKDPAADAGIIGRLKELQTGYAKPINGNNPPADNGAGHCKGTPPAQASFRPRQATYLASYYLRVGQSASGQRAMTAAFARLL
nr:hypothetical protein [Tanacetum cinerariifolium]